LKRISFHHIILVNLNTSEHGPTNTHIKGKFIGVGNAKKSLQKGSSSRNESWSSLQ